MATSFDNTHRSVAQTASLWADVSPCAPATESLKGSKKADVSIIGAGFCGLSAALHLAKMGVTVACLEAESVGWGASGRNNGQVIPGLKLDPDEVVKVLGSEAGERLVSCGGQAPDLVFSLIREYVIKCDALRKGWIQPARSNFGLRQIESRMNQWSRYQAPVQMIERSELDTRLGTNWYRGAWFDARGGSLNPLAYVRGLAEAALGVGVQLHTQSPVLAMQREGSRWRVKTPQGEVCSEQVLICTNAYGHLDDRLRRSIITVRTAQIASEPLQSGDWQRILPNGEAASDVSRLLTSFRITADNRLIMGGAYATGGKERPILFSALHEAAAKRFPFIHKAQWQYGWSGYLAVTPSHLPHIFELAPGCRAAIGCNGRGIAMTTATGKVLADLLTGNTADDCPLPISGPTPFPFHRFRNIGIAANVAWSRLLDQVNR